MFYIAHRRGLFRIAVQMNGKQHPKYTEDIREAMPFKTFIEAHKTVQATSMERDGYLAIVNAELA